MRFFLILALTLFTYTFTIAQDGGVRLGIQASPTFSWLASEDNTISSNGLRPGFKLGPIGEFYFRENYAFISGINLVFSAGGTLTHQMGGNLLPETAVGSNMRWCKPKISTAPARPAKAPLNVIERIIVRLTLIPA